MAFAHKLDRSSGVLRLLFRADHMNSASVVWKTSELRRGNFVHAVLEMEEDAWLGDLTVPPRSIHDARPRMAHP